MSAGKGDKPRPVDKKKFNKNFDTIFNKKTQPKKNKKFKNLTKIQKKLN